MAQYNPPSQNLPIFDSGLFDGTNSNTGSVPSGDFLNFPNAQGDENLLGITVADSATFNADSTFNDVVEINNDTTFSTNIIMSGTYLTNYIEFPDGSKQYAAGGGGSGDAQLSAGTSTTPQPFTGVNSFNNAGGIIIENTTNTTTTSTLYQNGNNLSINSSVSGGGVQLGDGTYFVILSTTPTGLAVNKGLNVSNGTNSNSILLKSDATTTKQLDVEGQVSIGNPTNSNTIVLASNTINNNQLNINGSCIITNGTNGTLLAQSNGNLEISTSTTGKGILLKDPSTNTSTLSVDTNGFVMNNGLSTGSDIYLNGLHLAKDGNTNGLNIIGAGMTIGNTTNSNYSILASDSTTNQVLNITGNATISSVQTYGTTYPDQNLATIKYVNGLASTGSAFLSAGTSTTPQIFTGYNQINKLRFNGMSCPQAIINLVNQYQTGLGSQWIWTTGIPDTLGNGFAFAFSTNNTPTPYTVASQEEIVPQANGVISGTGYALLQPYTYNSVNYNAYVLSITGFSGTASITARTVANNQGYGYPYYAIQTNDNNSYYSNNNIKMTLYIYPQGIV